MKALILDVGNSRTKLFAWDGPHQGPVLKPDHPSLLDLTGQWPTPGKSDDWSSIQQAIREICALNPGVPLVTTSVVPDILAALDHPTLDLVVVDHRCELPFACDIEDGAAVGADRYCNVAAAHGAGLLDALVVDVGTATTFDLLVGGVFIGGLIAPGPEFALKMIGQEAARLKPVPLERAPAEAGKNTREAMIRGGWNVGIGGINSCIEGLVRTYGPLPILLTGGLGHFLMTEGRYHDPHLTLRGAAVLAGLLTD